MGSVFVWELEGGIENWGGDWASLRTLGEISPRFLRLLSHFGGPPGGGRRRRARSRYSARAPSYQSLH